MTLLEKINKLLWFKHNIDIKEILLELYYKTVSNSTLEIHIIESGDFIVPDGTKTRMITLTDNNPQIVTLPAIESAIGSIYFITNDSTSTVDIISKSGEDDIWDGGLTFPTKMAIAGTPVRIINDGLNYKVL